MTKTLYYKGQWQEATNKDRIPVYNPFNQEEIATIAAGSRQDMDYMIDAADAAQKSFAKTSAYERSRILERLHDLILDHKQEFAEIMTLENGKPMSESLGEVAYAASFVKWYAEEAKRLKGRMLPGTNENRRIMVIKQPVGIVYAITPWNFPLAMITRKLAPALAAGCTFILKPSEETPLTAIKLYELLDQLELEPGVVNLITGHPIDMTDQVMKDSRVRKVTFTGSTEVGKLLMAQSAETMKNLSLELGGHAPLIVFEDADLDKAVQGTLASKFRNCGQACIASNRIYVHEKIHKAFEEKLIREVKKFKVGDGHLDSTTIGPIINEEGFKKIQTHIEDAMAKGADLAYGGTCKVNPQGGYLVEPTVLSHIKEDMAIYREETFGPVVPIVLFKEEEDVIQAANDSDYGLAAYFFTESVSRGFRVSEALEYGIIGFNTGGPSTAQAPFGGYKESGIGREGGQEGLDAYLETKYIALDL